VVQYRILAEEARRRGQAMPSDLDLRDYPYLRLRLASLRLDPDAHPIPSDTAPRLAFHACRALWRDPIAPLRRRVLSSVWFLAVSILPGPLVRPAVKWTFTPHTRPKALRWITRSH
jgi:hypothetical protein